ncbi:MAG: 50S ribosomal protein L25 [Bacteroidales bacterium]|nr:50S ribosomal protein L25 [Bacteroidales bacterium]
MKHLDLKGTLRVTGRKADVNSVRRDEKVPCVLYGNGMENVSFAIDAKSLKLVTNTPASYIINLDIEGKQYVTKLQAVQYHPVTDAALHADFLVLPADKPVTMEVPVKIVGNSEGVKQGGKLYAPTRKLRVSALIADLPDELVVDITPLQIGKQLSAGDLSFDKVTIVTPKATLVCAVRATRAAAAAAAAATAEK